MIRTTLLVLSMTLSAGLLLVNIYTSIVDAANWGSNLPTSIEAARNYYTAANPGTFFRIFSPLNQVLALVCLVACWRESKKALYLAAAALAFAVAADAFTFGYFYPRNAIMFASDIANIDSIRTAWTEWTAMNWVRSAIAASQVALISIAMVTVVKHQTNEVQLSTQY